MQTADDLKLVYSFIPAFQSLTVLGQYGSNALPLYAVGLHLGVQDFRSFASEALTDHAEDKKADIIHIDEAEHVACIAQGYVAQEWGKAEAKANKANDLNTAVAWLLQTPINDVPIGIREQAKLLRDGVTQKTIQRLIIAYAHNAFESDNVNNALQAVRHLLAGLEITKEVEVEVIELGLKRIEALYLAAEGVIQVSDSITVTIDQAISTQSTPQWTAYTFPLNGSVLHFLYDTYGDTLFSANLRDFLGVRKTSGNVNNRIKETVEQKPENFYVLNNGITIVTKKAVIFDDSKSLTLHGLSVVNGAQTTGAVHAAGEERAKNISVLTRVITVADEALISEIVAGNNTQNSVAASDRRSNNPVQIRIAGEFAAKGVEYVHRRSSSRKPKTALFADPVGQALCAFSGDLQTAIRARADIFELEAVYNRVFPPTLSIGHVFAVQTLSWAYDQFKGVLRAKADSETLTDIQTREYRLLNYPASKQFVICVVGELREEIAGFKLPDPRSFDLKQETISPDGLTPIEAWTRVLQAILPIMVQYLPPNSDEYQVVRSSDHMQTVAKATQGVVAAVPLLQTSFESLRALLKQQ
jgi:AIPR protein